MNSRDSRRVLFVQGIARGNLVKQAAEQASISETTAHRWLDQPEVQAEIARLQGDAYERTVAALGAYGSAMVTVLVELGIKGKSESVRARAANSYLELSLKIKAIDELEKRIAALEQGRGV